MEKLIKEEIKITSTIEISSSSSSSIELEESNIWGLLRQKGHENEYKLFHRIKDGRKDVYTIGKQKVCDIIINDIRINPIHCLIYCDYLNEILTMFIMNNSFNGTYVNNSLTKLSNGERTELKSGDEIYLTDPNSDNIISFTFINMRERLFVPKKVEIAPFSTTFQIDQSNQNIDNIPIERRIEDRYVIGDRIGHGMCGQVHICTDKSTMKQYAVKIIDTKKFSKTPGLSPSELRREAELMRNLKHPNIIQIQDTFETKHRIFIVMELVTGGDLFDRIIETGRYSEPAARTIMKQLLEGVRYLHDNGIVHRDIKPENILLFDRNPDSEIKISDFGLAKRATHEGLQTFCGTPQYFAPEVLGRRQIPTHNQTHDPSTTSTQESTRGYDFKADMWSLGVVLFIMLSGVFPFDENHLYDQLREARYSLEGSNWENVSNDAKLFIRSLMKLNPIDRLDVYQALNHCWITEDHTSVDNDNYMNENNFNDNNGNTTNTNTTTTNNNNNDNDNMDNINMNNSDTIHDSFDNNYNNYNNHIPLTSHNVYNFNKNYHPFRFSSYSSTSTTTNETLSSSYSIPTFATKPFTKVFWSPRIALSRTLTGEVINNQNCSHIQSDTHSADLVKHEENVYHEINNHQMTQIREDIEEYSSDEEKSQSKQTTQRRTKGIDFHDNLKSKNQIQSPQQNLSVITNNVEDLTISKHEKFEQRQTRKRNGTSTKIDSNQNYNKNNHNHDNNRNNNSNNSNNHYVNGNEITTNNSFDSRPQKKSRQSSNNMDNSMLSELLASPSRPPLFNTSVKEPKSKQPNVSNEENSPITMDSKSRSRVKGMSLAFTSKNVKTRSNK